MFVLQGLPFFHAAILPEGGEEREESGSHGVWVNRGLGFHCTYQLRAAGAPDVLGMLQLVLRKSNQESTTTVSHFVIVFRDLLQFRPLGFVSRTCKGMSLRMTGKVIRFMLLGGCKPTGQAYTSMRHRSCRPGQQHLAWQQSE